MGLSVVNIAEKKMESSTTCQSSSTKTERKTVEKNRRNQMKTLYSNLTSLIPNSSKEAVPLPDRLDEATNYIKSLQVNLERAKEKKERLLMGRKRMHTCPTTSTTSSSNNNMDNLKSPKMDIRVIGSSTLEVILTSGLHDQHLFYHIIRILHEERAEIVNSSISVNGNSIFLVVHAEIGEPSLSLGAAMITERLNTFVHGSFSTSEDDLQPELWDLEICPELLDL